MKILYISTAFPMEGTSTIYTDLAEALVSHGHEVTVVTKEERRNQTATSMNTERGCRVLRIRTGNMYDVGFIEKGASIITMAWLMTGAMRRNLKGLKVDLILFEAPPVTMERVAAYAKKRFGARAFLMMKDIFPQNAVDIGLMKKGGLVFRYFRHREASLYRTADMIGCMSEGNVRYLREVSGVEQGKLCVFPNTKKIRHAEVNRQEIRRKYGLPLDRTVFIFGGNMGKPQGLDFMVRAIISAEHVGQAFFVLVGRGTERKRVQERLKGQKNCMVLENLPRDEYDRLVSSCDVGLISLDHRFTVPNYPSRVLSYMECSMPVLGATDRSTDFKDLLVKDAKCGIWCDSEDVGAFVEAVRKLAASPEMRTEMGQNGRSYLEEHFSVDVSVKLLEDMYGRGAGTA